MSDLEKILWTSAATIIIGVIVYSFNQIVQKFIIEPIQDLRFLIGEIEDALIFYSNVFSNPGTCSNELQHEAVNKFRHLASLLSAKVNIIWIYKINTFLGFVPSYENIKQAHRNLIGLSNSVFAFPEGTISVPTQIKHNTDMKEEIRKVLKIKSID